MDLLELRVESIMSFYVAEKKKKSTEVGYTVKDYSL